MVVTELLTIVWLSLLKGVEIMSSVILTRVKLTYLAISTQFKKSSCLLDEICYIMCALMICALISKGLFRTYIFNLHFIKHCTFTDVQY